MRTHCGHDIFLEFALVTKCLKLWCPGAESNHRHCDFQSHALPTELPGHCPAQGARERRFIVRPGSPVHHASPSATHGAASLRLRVRHSPKGDDGRLRMARPRFASPSKMLENQA